MNKTLQEWEMFRMLGLCSEEFINDGSTWADEIGDLNAWEDQLDVDLSISAIIATLKEHYGDWGEASDLRWVNNDDLYEKANIGLSDEWDSHKAFIEFCEKARSDGFTHIMCGNMDGSSLALGCCVAYCPAEILSKVELKGSEPLTDECISRIADNGYHSY